MRPATSTSLLLLLVAAPSSSPASPSAPQQKTVLAWTYAAKATTQWVGLTNAPSALYRALSLASENARSLCSRATYATQCAAGKSVLAKANTVNTKLGRPTGSTKDTLPARYLGGQAQRNG